MQAVSNMCVNISTMNRINGEGKGFWWNISHRFKFSAKTLENPLVCLSVCSCWMLSHKANAIASYRQNRLKWLRFVSDPIKPSRWCVANTCVWMKHLFQLHSRKKSQIFPFKNDIQTRTTSNGCRLDLSKWNGSFWIRFSFLRLERVTNLKLYARCDPRHSTSCLGPLWWACLFGPTRSGALLHPCSLVERNRCPISILWKPSSQPHTPPPKDDG